MASALGEVERSWDEVLEAVGAADIEAFAALAGACKQALLEVVADKLELVARKPVLKLEVVGRYVLVDVQHK